MGVGDRDARQLVGEREGGGLLVALADHDPGIVRLDPVHERRDGIEHLVAEERAAEAVERVGNPHEAALGANRRRSPRPAKAAGNVLLEKRADEVAVARPDLLADDDRQLRSGRPGDLPGG